MPLQFVLSFLTFLGKAYWLKPFMGLNRGLTTLISSLASVQISCADSYANTVITKTHGAWVLLLKMGMGFGSNVYNIFYGLRHI